MVLRIVFARLHEAVSPGLQPITAAHLRTVSVRTFNVPFPSSHQSIFSSVTKSNNDHWQAPYTPGSIEFAYPATLTSLTVSTSYGDPPLGFWVESFRILLTMHWATPIKAQPYEASPVGPEPLLPRSPLQFSAGTSCSLLRGGRRGCLRVLKYKHYNTRFCLETVPLL